MSHKSPFLLLLLALGCASGAIDPADGLVLTGVSGDRLVLNRLWTQGCVPSANGASWSDVRRVLLTDARPFRLVTTTVDYLNESETPDCENGPVMTVTFTQEVAEVVDEGEVTAVSVPVQWVTADLAPASAPPGLEGITTGNGVSAIMTQASVRAESEAWAEGLGGFCGVDTWRAGSVVDTLLCFNGGDVPRRGRAVLVIDDRQTPWRNYQASNDSALDAQGFAFQVPNTLPFEGPFAP